MIIAVRRQHLLTANQRLHWAAKATRTKELRLAGCLAAEVEKHYTQQVRCTVTIMWPDRRRRDAHNIMPTLKALIDGMVSDGGMLPDDSDGYLIGPDLRVSESLCDKQYACVLRFDFREA